MRHISPFPLIGWMYELRNEQGSLSHRAADHLSREQTDADAHLLAAADRAQEELGRDKLEKHLPLLDLLYLDPLYNQHPYGFNYFMLNLLCDYRRPERISRVSGIPRDWNRSPYNGRRTALPRCTPYAPTRRRVTFCSLLIRKVLWIKTRCSSACRNSVKPK